MKDLEGLTWIRLEDMLRCRSLVSSLKAMDGNSRRKFWDRSKVSTATAPKDRHLYEFLNHKQLQIITLRSLRNEDQDRKHSRHKVTYFNPMQILNSVPAQREENPGR